MLSGWKTYTAAAVIGLATAIKYLGWIDEDVFQSIVAGLTAFGLIASRIGSLKTGDVQQSALTTEGKTK